MLQSGLNQPHQPFSLAPQGSSSMSQCLCPQLHFENCLWICHWSPEKVERRWAGNRKFSEAHSQDCWSLSQLGFSISLCSLFCFSGRWVGVERDPLISPLCCKQHVRSWVADVWDSDKATEMVGSPLSSWHCGCTSGLHGWCRNWDMVYDNVKKWDGCHLNQEKSCNTQLKDVKQIWAFVGLWWASSHCVPCCFSNFIGKQITEGSCQNAARSQSIEASFCISHKLLCDAMMLVSVCGPHLEQQDSRTLCWDGWWGLNRAQLEDHQITW